MLGFWVIKSSKNIFCKQNIHQNLFFYKSNSLRNLIRCQTCLFEIWQILKISIRNCRVVKNGSKSDTFEISESKHDASPKKCFKNRLFSKSLIQFLSFEWKHFFPQHIFRMHKKANIDVFTVYTDQLNRSLRASFPKNFDFLTTVFSSKTDAL